MNQDLTVDYNQYPSTEELVDMSKIEWLTVNAAAELPECPVTGETLRQMIKRGEVPEGHWMEVPYGKNRITYYIDKTILSKLNYRNQGGQKRV
jgi:hypothetical protein